MKKKIIAFITAFSCITSTASASILGSDWVDGSSLLFGKGTSFYKNTFFSDQKGVGLQTEYYAEYTPNDDVRPVVVTGDAIWGKRNISEAVEYMENNGMYPMIGINASFFSFQNGVPMGHVITDGEITSKDETLLDAVGFYEDGNAFISKLGITTTAYFDEYEFDVPHINKYCQAVTNVMTLYTDKFGENTHASTETVNIVLGELEGEVAIGKEISGKIEEIKVSAEPVEIPEGKIVMTVPAEGDEWVRTIINLMSVGETVTIKSEATYDAEKWNKAYNGLASEGKRLLEGGEVCSGLEAGSAPRTAVGIKEDGNVVFYVLDGRQIGYSYGAKQSTVAKRLSELGCVDALNLDGGGSTSIAGVYPGQEASAVINSPSEGSLRKVTNFIFLQNMREAEGTLGGLYLYPYSESYLSGTSVQLYPAAVDKSFHYMEAQSVEFSMGNELGTVTEDGVLTLSGTGEAIVNVKSGDITGGATYSTYETPTSVEVYDTETNKSITSITADAKTSFSLGAHSYHGKKYLISEPKAYNWDIDEKIGTVKDGILTLSSRCGESGSLRVSAGDKTVVIPITINDYAEDACYPAGSFLSEDGYATVEVCSEKSEPDIENCSFKIDGRECIDEAIKTKVDDNTVRISVYVGDDFENEFHKLTVKAQNKDGFASYIVKSIENSYSENVFSDTAAHWAGNRIAYMNKMGIVNGSDGYFYPESYVTRAEFAVMMCGYLGINPDDYKDVSVNFADISSVPAWATGYVKAMSENGIISGKSDGGKVLFAPNDNITRAEAASIMARTIKDNIKIREADYVDAADIPEWARKNMRIMAANGFIGGYPDKTVKPNGNVTRAEAASMIYNMI